MGERTPDRPLTAEQVQGIRRGTKQGKLKPSDFAVVMLADSHELLRRRLTDAERFVRGVAVYRETPHAAEAMDDIQRAARQMVEGWDAAAARDRQPPDPNEGGAPVAPDAPSESKTPSPAKEKES